MSEEDLEEGGGGGGGDDEEEEEGVMDDNECWDEEEAEEQSLGQSPANDVELVIKPLPHGERTDPSLSTIRYLKTTMQATVDHISKYLEMRYDFDHNETSGVVNGTSAAATTAAEESASNLPSTSSVDTNGGGSGSSAAPASTSATSSTSGEVQAAAAANANNSATSSGVSGGGGDVNTSSSTSTSTTSSSKKCPFAVFIAAGPGQFHPLPGDWSLTAVSDKYWKVNRPLELFYAYKMASTKLADPPAGASARW